MRRLIKATPRDREEIKAFDERVIFQEDADNPFLVSFLRDEQDVLDSLEGLNHYRFFILRDEDTGNIVARCGVNLSLTSEDIYAYGSLAKQVFDTKKAASLVGDLVDPAHRGQNIQASMIDQRLSWLQSQGFEYAVAGIIEGNEASTIHFARAGFEALGEKAITWDLFPERTDIVRLVGRPL